MEGGDEAWLAGDAGEGGLVADGGVFPEVEMIGVGFFVATNGCGLDAVGVAIGVEPVPVPGGADGAHVVGDAAGRGAGSWSEAVREGRDLGRQLAGRPAVERPSYRDDRSRCFDRSVTVLSARPPAHEVEAVDARTCRSIRLGFDEQGRWVQVVAMGWKLRADRIGRPFEAGLERRDLLQMRPFFNEPEGTRLPEKEWLQLLGIHQQ